DLHAFPTRRSSDITNSPECFLTWKSGLYSIVLLSSISCKEVSVPRYGFLQTFTGKYSVNSGASEPSKRLILVISKVKGSVAFCPALKLFEIKVLRPNFGVYTVCVKLDPESKASKLSGKKRSTHDPKKASVTIAHIPLFTLVINVFISIILKICN